MTQFSGKYPNSWDKEDKQEGKELYLDIKVDNPYVVNVVELSPPPLSYDKDIKGLKRIDIRLEREAFPGDRGSLVVELTNEPR